MHSIAAWPLGTCACTAAETWQALWTWTVKGSTASGGHCQFPNGKTASRGAWPCRIADRTGVEPDFGHRRGRNGCGGTIREQTSVAVNHPVRDVLPCSDSAMTRAVGSTRRRSTATGKPTRNTGRTGPGETRSSNAHPSTPPNHRTRTQKRAKPDATVQPPAKWATITVVPPSGCIQTHWTRLRRRERHHAEVDQTRVGEAGHRRDP